MNGSHDTFLHNHGWNLSPSRFRSENVMFLQDYDVITGGFPQKLGIPRNFVMILCRNMSYDTLIWSNDTCFVENFI